MKAIACVVVIGVAVGVLALMFSNISHFLHEKYSIRKTKDKYEIFNTKKWMKIEREKNIEEDFLFNVVNSEIARWDEQGLFSEEDRQRLNKRIKELNFVMEQFRGGDKEYRALKKEVQNLNHDLIQGMYFKEYRKKIKEKIEEIKKSIDLSNIEEENMYEVDFVSLGGVLGYIETNFKEKTNSSVIKKADDLNEIKRKHNIGTENRKELEELEVKLIKLLDTKIEEWERNKNKEDEENAKKIEERMKKVVED